MLTSLPGIKFYYKNFLQFCKERDEHDKLSFDCKKHIFLIDLSLRKWNSVETLTAIIDEKDELEKLISQNNELFRKSDKSSSENITKYMIAQSKLYTRLIYVKTSFIIWEEIYKNNCAILNEFQKKFLYSISTMV